MSKQKSQRRKKRKPSAREGPVKDWSTIRKPRLEVKTGVRAKEARRAEASQPLSRSKLLMQLSPIILLLIVILILAPTLPFRAIGAGVNFLAGLIPEPKERPVESNDPVFIVEEAESAAPINSELPVPDWKPEISSIFRPEVQYWEADIVQWSYDYRLKPNLIATIMQIESCGDPDALSGASAMGLFQVTGIHFQAEDDPFAPEDNARRGMLYMGELIAMVSGDTGLAFAGYNAGPSVLYAPPADWPTETQSYQYWASGIYEESELGFTESPTLEEWLDAGGWSLCAQASESLGLN